MKPRDGDDAIRDSHTFDRKGRGAKTPPAAGHCPACKAEIPAKAGFRFSALKCPMCGAAAVKN